MNEDKDRFMRLKKMILYNMSFPKVPGGVGVYWMVTWRPKVTFTMCHQTTACSTSNTPT